jgi:integrase
MNATHHRVHIRNAKGNKDRLVPLPQNTLRILRRFWSLHRHPQFLFPSRKRGLENAHLASIPMDRGGVQGAMNVVVREMGLKKRLHATRSATATQLIFWRPVSTWSNYRKFSGTLVY